MRTDDIFPRHFLSKSVCIILVLFLVTSCSLFTFGKKGVFFKEMSKVPGIVTYDNEFVVQTGNSNQNSALLIYKITVKIDTLRKRIELKGYQAVNKKYQDTFKINVKGYKKANLDNYEFYWIDPDHKDNRLDVK